MTFSSVQFSFLLFLLRHISYISSITAKASTGTYQILYSFSSNNVWVLLKAYTTYVRPILEYNSVIWSP